MTHSIKVFKHEHSGTEVLNELEKEIRDCDLVLPEIAILTHEQVRGKIAKHSEMLEGRITNEEYLSWAVQTNDPYSTGFWNLLVNYRKPMIPLESFSEDESNAINQRFTHAQVLFKKSFDALRSGYSKKALEELASYVGLMNDLTDKRDKNMSQRMENIAQITEVDYPFFQGDLKILAPLGYDHKPERYFRPNSLVTIDVHESKIRVPENVGIRIPVIVDLDEMSKLFLTFALTSAMKSYFYTTAEIANARKRLLPYFSESVLRDLCSHLIQYGHQQFALASYDFFQKRYHII